MPGNSEQEKLARSILEATRSSAWRDVIHPYLERERLNQIEMMASMTDSLQLMRYAGAIQAIGSLMNMDRQAKKILEKISE